MKSIYNATAILSFLALAFLISACGEEDIKIEEIDPPIVFTPLKPDPEHDLYLTYDESIESVWVPKYVDAEGKVVAITDGKRSAQTVAMHVDDDRNVYIVGWHTDSHRQMYPVIWKNLQPTLLTDTTLHKYAVPTGMRVVGDDMYVVGYAFGKSYSAAAYWKNGELVVLTDGESSSAVALDIWVDGNDVYVAGSIKTVAGKDEAYYWKNGVATKLKGTYASGILKKDNSLYITGNFGSRSYWKDGSYISLAGGRAATKGIGPHMMQIFGNDLYLVGIGEYWKNDDPATIISSESISATFDFFAYGDDIYFGGFKDEADIYLPTYWKNGAAVPVTDGKHHGGVSTIFAKEKKK